MTRSAVQYIPMLLTWAAVAYKLPSVWHRPAEPARRSLWLTLGLLALAQTVLLPPVYLGIDRLVGVANLSLLLGNGLVLGASWTVQSFFLHLNYPDERARWRIHRYGSALAGTLALMLALFLLAPIHHESVDFWRQYGRAPFILAYRFLYLAYLALALITVMRLSWRYARVGDRPALSLGLRLVALGGLLGLGYCLHEGLRVTVLALGRESPLLESDAVTQILIAGTIGFTVVGATMPAWGPYVGVPELCRWLSRYRSYRRLYPLWRALYEVHPEIALMPPSSMLADVLTARDLDFRLYRRVVEIRDGGLALRPFIDPSVVGFALEQCRAAGLLTEETKAVVEAASMAAALYATSHGEAIEMSPSHMDSLGGADVRSEVRALERVAHCYQHSPIVRAVVRHQKERDASPPNTLTRVRGRP